MGQVAKNGAVFLDGTRPLDEALHVSGPYKADEAPNAYSFDRVNTLDIRWDQVLQKANFKIPKNKSDQFRMYVEKAWQIKTDELPPAEIIDENTFSLAPAWPAYVHKAESVQNAKATRPGLLTLFRSTFKEHRLVPVALEEVDVISGCVFQIKRGKSIRWYQPIIEKDGSTEYPTKEDFAAEKWLTTWELITAMVQVYFPGKKPDNAAEADIKQKEAKKEAREYFAAIDLIRADAATIDRQYQMLMNEAPLVEALEKKATELANEISNAPFEIIPSLANKFRELKNSNIELKAKKRRLADAASDLNYHLFVEQTPIEFYEDNTGTVQKETLNEGTLYTKSSKTASWITYQTVTRKSSSYWGLKQSSSSYPVPIHHSKTYDYYEKSVIDHDPWVEILEFYKFHSFEVFQFRYTAGPGGLVAADGSRPQDILARCDSDEEFRRRCVIALPHKEITLLGESYVVGYHLFVRPVPDIAIATYPTLSLREQLSYRFTWMGVALGEMAATIPLSPGEEREVTLATSKRYESSRTETASSLIDITHIDKSDFETVFEKEVRKENETTTTFGAEASGSYAGVVSGSANFSTTKTTKEVARQLNRSVQRASQEVNRRSKDERTVTISEKTETTHQNTTTFRVKNINQGSTLNIAFYRLFNAYQSVLKVENFDYMIRGGKSPIASVDILDERAFDRDSFSDLLLYVKENFPFDLSKITEDGWIGFEAELRAQILEAYKDYKTEAPNLLQGESDDNIDADLDHETTHSLDSLASQFRQFDDTEPRQNLQQIWKGLLLKQKKEEEAIIGIPLWEERTNFAYDSGGLYADVYIGTRPATEPYAEAMRRLEEEKASNENSLIAARARYLNARASRQVLALADVFDPKKMYVTDVDVLLVDDGHPEVKLRMVPGILSSAGWSLKIKDATGIKGGSFLQSSVCVDGIMVFELPLRLQEIANKGHPWFKDNISVYNADLGVTAPYIIS
jgi:hypothetical protein